MSIKALKKGDKVVMHTCIEAEAHDGKIWTCRTDEFKHHSKHDYTVVMLEGFSGSFQTEYLQKVDVSHLENKIAGLNDSLSIYKTESDEYEKSTYINDFMYEPKVDRKGEIPILINVHGVEHTLGITKNDAKMFHQIFKETN